MQNNIPEDYQNARDEIVYFPLRITLDLNLFYLNVDAQKDAGCEATRNRDNENQLNCYEST